MIKIFSAKSKKVGIFNCKSFEKTTHQSLLQIKLGFHNLNVEGRFCFYDTAIENDSHFCIFFFYLFGPILTKYVIYLFTVIYLSGSSSIITM